MNRPLRLHHDATKPNRAQSPFRRATSNTRLLRRLILSLHSLPLHSLCSVIQSICALVIQNKTFFLALQYTNAAACYLHYTTIYNPLTCFTAAVKHLSHYSVSPLHHYSSCLHRTWTDMDGHGRTWPDMDTHTLISVLSTCKEKNRNLMKLLTLCITVVSPCQRPMRLAGKSRQITSHKSQVTNHRSHSFFLPTTLSMQRVYRYCS